MSSAQFQAPGDLGQVANLGSTLMAHVKAAAGDLQRLECLDEEQRAEIHAILEAMLHDSESHVRILQGLSGGQYASA
jgi:hypothetical protein